MKIQLPWLTATTMAVAVAARPWPQPQQQKPVADATYFFTLYVLSLIPMEDTIPTVNEY